jgi:hypothetical protein
MPSTAEDMMGDYPWTCPNPPDYSLEELAQINLRIHLAGRALAAPGRALVSMSSPAVDEIFGAACSLINLVDRYTSKRTASLSKSRHDGGEVQNQRNVETVAGASFDSSSLPVSPVIDSALDSSIRLMIHACHQALLGVFEDLSTSFLVQLAELAKLQQPTPPGTPPSSSVFSPCSTQVGVMTNLMDHLVYQLNRAIGSLSSLSSSAQFLAHRATRFSPMNLRQDSPECGISGAFVGHHEHPHSHFGGHHVRGQEKASASLFREMEHRQLRVRDQMRSVERLLRQ